MTDKNIIEERIEKLKEAGPVQQENGRWDFRWKDISNCNLDGIDIEYALYDDATK